jgi:hypothetical protein
MKTCICENCEDCRLYRTWVLTDDKGEKKVSNRCDIQVVAEELPRFKGTVDGLQTAVNESRNRSIETKKMVEGFITGMIGLATQKGRMEVT